MTTERPDRGAAALAQGDRLRAKLERLRDLARSVLGVADQHRELAARFWVHYRCGYVGCEIVEQHEHGGGSAMREMTPDERDALELEGSAQG